MAYINMFLVNYLGGKFVLVVHVLISYPQSLTIVALILHAVAQTTRTFVLTKPQTFLEEKNP